MADSPNLIRNGDFGAGVWGWSPFDDAGHAACDPCDDWSSVYTAHPQFHTVERRPLIALDNDPCDNIHYLTWSMHALLGKWGPTGQFKMGELAPMFVLPGYGGHKTNWALYMLSRMSRMEQLTYLAREAERPRWDIEGGLFRGDDGLIVIDSYVDGDKVTSKYGGDRRSALMDMRIMADELPERKIVKAHRFDRDANPRSLKDTRRLMGRGHEHRAHKGKGR